MSIAGLAGILIASVEDELIAIHELIATTSLLAESAMSMSVRSATSIHAEPATSILV